MKLVDIYQSLNENDKPKINVDDLLKTGTFTTKEIDPSGKEVTIVHNLKGLDKNVSEIYKVRENIKILTNSSNDKIKKESTEIITNLSKVIKQIRELNSLIAVVKQGN